MEQEQSEIAFSVLIFQEHALNASGWVAQCLDYDIVSQGDTISEVKQRLARTVIGQICVDISRGRDPLEGIPSAPV